MKKTITAVFAALLFTTSTAHGSVEAPKPPKQEWSFNGIFGTYDRGAAQRGFTVYKNVCSACHSLNYLSYRHLAGIGFTAPQVKAIASTVDVTDGPNDDGEMFKRKGLPKDRFLAPFANEKAARAANNGAFPPDLSLIVKARHGGSDYIYALLTGYAKPPKDVKLMEGMSYNKYFPGHQIAMMPPLSDGAVEYADGTKPTVAQIAHDVSTFLTWAASPEMENRKRLGIKVLLFLLVLTGMLFALKRQVWSKLHK